LLSGDAGRILRRADLVSPRLDTPVLPGEPPGGADRPGREFRREASPLHCEALERAVAGREAGGVAVALRHSLHATVQPSTRRVLIPEAAGEQTAPSNLGEPRRVLLIGPALSGPTPGRLLCGSPPLPPERSPTCRGKGKKRHEEQVASRLSRAARACASNRTRRVEADEGEGERWLGAAAVRSRCLLAQAAAGRRGSDQPCNR